MWWNIATDESKQQLIKLVQNGQLEIVTGGWVMTDEANAHYYAMVDQMIEGVKKMSIVFFLCILRFMMYTGL